MMNLTNTENCIKHTKIKNEFEAYVIENKYRKGNLKTFARGLIHNFTEKCCGKKRISDINGEFVHKFYFSYLTHQLPSISMEEIKYIAREWYYFSLYIARKYGEKELLETCSHIYYDLLSDIYRVLTIALDIRKFCQIPVLSWQPLIIDLQCYKNFIEESKVPSATYIYGQGYFTVFDKIGPHVIFEKKRANELFKVRVDIKLSKNIEIGDVAHMSIKRRHFSNTWMIIQVKGYYGKAFDHYLKLGGQ